MVLIKQHKPPPLMKRKTEVYKSKLSMRCDDMLDLMNLEKEHPGIIKKYAVVFNDNTKKAYLDFIASMDETTTTTKK